jgi:hypothetical protein
MEHIKEEERKIWRKLLFKLCQPDTRSGPESRQGPRGGDTHAVKISM